MRRRLTLIPVLSVAMLTLTSAAQTAAPATPASTAPAAVAPQAATEVNPAKRAKVEQVLSLTNTDKVSQQMLAGFPDRVKTLAARQPMVQAASTPEQKKLTADYLDQMGKIAGTAANWDAAKPKIVDLYMTSFSEADLDGMIAFYNSAAGKAMVSKTPELAAKTIDILQSPITLLGPQFEAATKAYQTSMQNTSPAGGTGAAAPAKPPTLGPDNSATKPATPKK